MLRVQNPVMNKQTHSPSVGTFVRLFLQVLEQKAENLTKGTQCAPVATCLFHSNAANASGKYVYDL